MRRFTGLATLCLLMWGWHGIGVSAPAAPAPAGAAREYTVGMGKLDEFLQAQYKTIFDDIFGIIKQKYNVTLKNVVFTDDAQLMAAARKGTLDFFFSLGYDQAMPFLDKKGPYAPVASTSMYGMRDYEYCLFVRKDSPVKTIGDLRGKRAMTYTEMYDYFILRRLLGEKPEEFFSPLRIGPNSTSYVYALSMGDVDAAFVTTHTISLLRLTNPGPVKGIRQVACSRKYPIPPVFLARSVPPEIAELMKQIFIGLRDRKEFGKYLPLMKKLDLRYLPVAIEEYDGVAALQREALKKGWDRDYARWIRIARSGESQ